MTILYVGFSCPKKWNVFSWLIEKVDHRNFSHTYVMWHSDSLNRDLLYEATTRCVRFQNGPGFTEKNETVARFAIPATDAQMADVMRLCIDFAGYEYGFKQCLGIAWVHFRQLFGGRVTNPFSDDTGTMVCSEVVYRVLTIVAPDIVEHLDPDTVTPGDLYQRIVERI